MPAKMISLMPNWIKEGPRPVDGQAMRNVACSLAPNRSISIWLRTTLCLASLLAVVLGTATAQSQDTDAKTETEILIDQASLMQRVGHCATLEPPQVTTKPAGLEYEIDFSATDGMPREPGGYEFTVNITEPGWKGSLQSELTLIHTEGILITDTVFEYDGEAKQVTILSGLPDDETETKVLYRPADSPADWSPHPPSAAGKYDVLAKEFIDSCLRATGTATLRIKKGSQTIDFPSISDKPVHKAPFTLEAEADSGLPVHYSVVSGPATICGRAVSLTSETGTVVVRARQPGNKNWEAADPVEQSIQILPSKTAIGSSLQIQLSEDKITLVVNADNRAQFLIERSERLIEPKWEPVGTVSANESLCLERNHADIGFFRARPTD